MDVQKLHKTDDKLTWGIQMAPGTRGRRNLEIYIRVKKAPQYFYKYPESDFKTQLNYG